MRAEVEFLGSALLFGVSSRAVIHAAELVRQQEEDERRWAEEQSRYDDD